MAIKLLTHSINAPVEKLFPFFSDINKFVEIHPVIYNCIPLSQNEYTLFEKLNLFFYKPSFSYTVKMEQIIPNQRVVMFSVIRKGVTLKLSFDFKEVNNTTVITETVDFNGPPGINNPFLAFLSKTHYQLIKNLVDTVVK